MTEASLSSAEDLISRAREISVQGSNSVLGPEDRAILATEIEAIRDQLFQVGNTQSPMGDYGFAGHATDRPQLCRQRRQLLNSRVMVVSGR